MPGIPYAQQNLKGFHDLGQSKGLREYDESHPFSGIVAGLATAVGTAAKAASMFAGMGQQTGQPSLFPPETGLVNQGPNLNAFPGGLPSLNDPTTRIS